jgi:signal transduction histidine kinase
LYYFTYLRLIVLTAGTLLPFFWIVVILGHRRQRNFERIFFFLCLALIFFFGASLLALNAELHYSTIPSSLAIFTWTVLCVGLWFLPALLIHLHVEYAQIRELLKAGNEKRLWLIAVYAPAVLLLPRVYSALRLQDGRDFVLPGNSLGQPFQAWLVCALLICTVWQWRFEKSAPDDEQKSFHRILLGDFALMSVWLLVLHFAFPRWGGISSSSAALYTTIVGCFALAPLVGLIRNVQRFNFLQIGRQRNLIYAVFMTFLGLLYLSFVRRISLWLEPYLPPEASAAILLFLPVVFFEPLQRLMGRILHRTAQSEMDRTQRMMGAIHEVARLGSLEELTTFVEKWIREQLQLAEVELRLDGAAGGKTAQNASEEVFIIRQAGRDTGSLFVRAHGAMLSGETVAALEFLCEQLPGALDLCGLIEEKLRLERELAERDRLALVGQMAASISHNLKNPLGSMKTILQVQLENPELPESIRGETKMVLEEIGRLSTKLNQLLQFSRPTVRGGSATGSCDARAVVEEVASVLSHEAERRGVTLQACVRGESAKIAASAEALNDIVSNLVVNALEAAPRDGRVIVTTDWRNGTCVLGVEDDGAGIPETLREKILQPFFTTKPQGTGLGLAIVARRAAEFGGKVDWESPVKNGHGTRFRVMLPLEEVME